MLYGKSQLNVVFYGFRKTPYPNLGVAYLVSNLRKHQFNYSFQYLESFEDITSASEEICKMAPDIVGLTAVSADFNKARILSKKLKENCKATILMGGSHISSVPQTLPPEIDIGFLGESEETIIDIFTLFKENRCTVKNLRKVKGIAFFDEEKKLHINQRRIYPKNLDCLPRPARDLFGPEYWKDGLTSLITSRGCPYHCSFCQITTEWKSCRYHSAEYVVEEVKELVNNYGIHTFGIVDDLFVAKKIRIGEITEKLKEVGLLGKVHFTVNGRANLINRELVEMLKEMGTTQIALGLESMSPRILPLLKDKVTVEDNKRAVETIYKCGFKTGGLFMIGTPSETKKDLEITYNYVKKNRHKFGGMQVCVTTPLPQTPLWELCVEKGLINPNIEEFDWDLLNVAAEDIRTNLYVGDIDRDVFIKILPKFRKLFFDPDLVDENNKLKLVGKMLRKAFSLKAARLIFADPFLLCRKFLHYLELMKNRPGNLFNSESNEECTSDFR